MKIVKLVIAFIIITGAILLAINWNNIFAPTPDDEKFPNEDKLNISEECAKIRSEWERCTGFDINIYKSLRSDIDQSKTMGLFSREGYNIVNNCLRETSINKACDAYNNEIGNTVSFMHKKVCNCYKDVEELKELEQLDNTVERVNQVIKLHEYYSKVKKFTDSSHPIRARFDTENADWTSFASQKQYVLSQGDKLLNNPLYTKVKHIPGFEKGLSQAFLRSATDKWRSSFYEDLSSQIINHFETLEPTEDRVNLLRQIYKNFVNQEDESGVEELAAFVVRYKVPEVKDDESENI